jgi:Recombinase
LNSSRFARIRWPPATIATDVTLMLNIYAAPGEKERKLIASRTKAALAVKKAQGVVLGGPNLARARKASKALVTANADRHAANVIPIINAVRKAGGTTLRDIATALNARGVRTARGGAWHAMTVKNVLDRAGHGEGPQGGVASGRETGHRGETRAAAITSCPSRISPRNWSGRTVRGDEGSPVRSWKAVWIARARIRLKNLWPSTSHPDANSLLYSLIQRDVCLGSQFNGHSKTLIFSRPSAFATNRQKIAVAIPFDASMGDESTAL